MLGIWVNVLIVFIDKVISIFFKKMLTYTGSFKPKPKNGQDIPAQYSSCYPLDNNRRSLAGTTQPLKVRLLPCRKIKFTARSTPNPTNQTPIASL